MPDTTSLVNVLCFAAVLAGLLIGLAALPATRNPRR
jgi:hypothetical protein